MNQIARGIVALAMTLPAFGCDWLADRVSDHTTTAGPKPLAIAYETVDLPALLDPERHAKRKLGAEWDTLPEGKRIDLAFSAFHTEYPVETERDRRDQVQERLLGISNQLCSRYLAYMQNIHSDGNFVLGSLATIAGAAGAIFSGGASQILAGTAGALSGVRAEFNQDYFSNLTVAVITSGINLKRHEIYDEIVRYGAQRDERHYSVEAAVKDALFYHGECSLMAGVEKAGDSIKLAQDPGLDAVNRTLFKVNQMRKIAQEQITDPAEVPGMGANTIKLLQAGKPTGGDFIDDSSDTLPNVTLALLKLQAAKLGLQAAGRLDKISTLTAAPDGGQRKQMRDAISSLGAAIDVKIGSCKVEADTVTAKIVSAVGQQAAAANAEERQKADVTLRSALIDGAAVGAKARIPVDVFARKLSEVLSNLEEADRKAKAKGADELIPDNDVVAAQDLITKAVEFADPHCAG